MCGIFGALNVDISRDKAIECVNELIHRGPDGWGVWQENKVTLGHRRLSILDLSENGKQPMSYADERYWLTFNGEIYNFLEIREELQAKGYTFKSDTDSEVIMAAFIEWQEECQLKFNGMWAFAIWDRQEEKLFMSRDRFGVKSLYYMYTENGGMAFASEMKGIMPLISEPKANEDMIKYYLNNLHYEMLEDCLVQGIKRFPAGSCAWVDRTGKMTIKRWWNTLDHLMEVPDTYEEQVEMLRDLFMDACKIRMRSDVTLGTALSGGLDSSATICAMAHIEQENGGDRVNNDWQHAYVACFPGAPSDETKYAKMVTDYLGINSTFYDNKNVISEKELYRQTYIFEDMWNNTQIPIIQLYEQERKGGTLVSLDGHAADELFAGYGFNVLKALPDAKNKKEIEQIFSVYFDQSTVREYNPDSAYFKKQKRKIYTDEMARYWGKKILGRPQVRSEYMNHPNWNKLDNLNKTLFVSTHETILPTLLRNFDRNSMASGVEIRMPFLDYRIVCFAFSIGWRSKLHNGYSKSIIRDAVAPYMPKDIAYRKTKIGFNAPLGTWFKGTYRDMFTDIVNSEDFLNCKLIEAPKKVKTELQKVIDCEYLDSDIMFKDSIAVWNQIQIFLWEQAVIKGKGKNN